MRLHRNIDAPLTMRSGLAGGRGLRALTCHQFHRHIGLLCYRRYADLQQSIFASCRSRVAIEYRLTRFHLQRPCTIPESTHIHAEYLSELAVFLLEEDRVFDSQRVNPLRNLAGPIRQQSQSVVLQPRAIRVLDDNLIESLAKHSLGNHVKHLLQHAIAGGCKRFLGPVVYAHRKARRERVVRPAQTNL